jgi:hypothetical protein
MSYVLAGAPIFSIFTVFPTDNRFLCMKKLILCVSAAIVTAASFQYVTAGVNTATNEAVSSNTQTNKIVSIADYINGVYHSIDFGGAKKLDSAVFQKAYYGYMNLKEAGKIMNENLLTVCDFSQSSTKYRLWVIDLLNKKVLMNDYVAHGQGSGDEFATAFSNRENSHQTSLGFYVTDDTYVGKHGTSLRLHGMDKGFNDAAYDRAVVVHGADYVSPDFVAGQRKLGRSWGCPAVSNQLATKLINAIKGGSCLFIYYPSKEYLQTAYWVNKKLDLNNPSTANIAMLERQQVKRDTITVYESEELRQRLTVNKL